MRLVRLTIKWLNAGVMDGIEWKETGRGVPQGAIVSPILANLYLHYVFDLWVNNLWCRRKAKGDLIVVRYADDFVVGFQYRREAEAFLIDLRERMTRFGLHLPPDKTKLIEFGRYAAINRKNHGLLGKPEIFDFLGMTHYCDKSWKRGRFRVGRRPAGKRVRQKLIEIREELFRRMHWDKETLAKWLGKVIAGWLNYYAVPGTSKILEAFCFAVKRYLLKALRRRSQFDRTKWVSVDGLVKRFWAKPSIRHPWPGQ